MLSRTAPARGHLPLLALAAGSWSPIRHRPSRLIIPAPPRRPPGRPLDTSRGFLHRTAQTVTWHSQSNNSTAEHLRLDACTRGQEATRSNVAAARCDEDGSSSAPAPVQPCGGQSNRDKPNASAAASRRVTSTCSSAGRRPSAPAISGRRFQRRSRRKGGRGALGGSNGAALRGIAWAQTPSASSTSASLPTAACPREAKRNKPCHETRSVNDGSAWPTYTTREHCGCALHLSRLIGSMPMHTQVACHDALLRCPSSLRELTGTLWPPGLARWWWTLVATSPRLLHLLAVAVTPLLTDLRKRARSRTRSRHLRYHAR